MNAYFNRSLRLLADFPGFGWFTASQSISYFNVEMWYVLLPLLTVGMTGDPFWMGAVAASGYLPFLFAGVPAGWWVDRSSASTVMIVCAAVRAVIFLIIGWAGLAGRLPLPAVAAAAFLIGLFWAAHATARRVLIRRLVGRVDAASANSVDEANLGIAEVVGTLAGGLFAAWLGVHQAVLIQAGLLGLFVVAMLQVKETHEPVVSDDRGLREGFAFYLGGAFANRLLLATVILAVLVFGCCMAFFGLQIFYYRHSLGISVERIAWMASAVSVIGLAGPVLVDLAIRRYGLREAIFGCCAAVALGLLAVAYARSTATVCLAAGIILAGGKAFRVGVVSLAHEWVPDAVLGRVLGVFSMFAEGATPAAIFAAGALAKAVGFPAAFLAAGIIGVLCCAGYYLSPFGQLKHQETLREPQGEPAVTA